MAWVSNSAVLVTCFRPVPSSFTVQRSEELPLARVNRMRLLSGEKAGNDFSQLSEVTLRRPLPSGCAAQIW